MVNEQAEELLIINPLLYSVTDRYIWIDESYGERRNAQCLFDYLLRRKIYVKGFATNASRLIGLKMYNKIIVDINMEDESRTVFFDTNFRLYRTLDVPDIQKARIVNPHLIQKNIVIWGAGSTGEKVYQILVENNFTVKCFIDSAIEKQGTFKCGLPVYHPKYLENYGSDCAVIEALEKWKDLDDSIKEKEWKRFHFSYDVLLPDIICNVDGTEKKLFSLSVFWIFNHFVGKKVFIYGNGIIEREFAEYLQLMDYNFGGFLIDSNEEKNNIICKYVEEILYDEEYYIWIYDKSKAGRLKELGLKCLEQWECNGFPSWDVTTSRQQGLDINLGITSLTGDKYPGIVIYGEDKKEDYKIAILGASTAESKLYPFRSWAQLLYEELSKCLSKNTLTIYNGSVSGYTSGQELIKLIRDIIPLNPNMIIVYDGGNEFGTDVGYPFCFPYAKRVYEFGGKHMEEDDYTDFSKGVYAGINNGLNEFKGWLFNSRNMHAIAVDHNIKFFNFCQPILGCKEGMSYEEKNIMLSMPSGQADTYREFSFRKQLMKEENIPNYIYNITDIFDNIDDIYLDAFHVKNEKANRIIANKIKEVVYPTILNDMQQ